MVELTLQQQIGAKYNQDFMKPLTRKQREELISLISQSTKCKVEATGGYRREKESSNNLDLIIIHPDIPAEDLNKCD